MGIEFHCHFGGCNDIIIIFNTSDMKESKQHKKYTTPSIYSSSTQSRQMLRVQEAQQHNVYKQKQRTSVLKGSAYK